MRFEKLSEEHDGVIAPAGRPLAQAQSVSWPGLADAPWVLTRKPSLARVFVEDSFRRDGAAPPTPRCETDSRVTAARLVAAGVGLSSVPESMARDALRSQTISLVKVRTPQPGATLGMVYRTDAAEHPRIGLLRQALRLGR